MLPNVQCFNVTIPDMIEAGGPRSLLNLAYHPRDSGELLTCNSFHQVTETTCDSWAFGQEVNDEETWASGHSSPHKEDSLRKFNVASPSHSPRYFLFTSFDHFSFIIEWIV